MSHSEATEAFDYIIVGAGSAGCVLANRLTQDGRRRVLLIEAGGSHRRLFVTMPAGLGEVFYDPKVNWCFETEPDQQMAGRSDYWPRGKVLGGSSSINGMVYIRGQREDFDDWARLGNPGWGYEDVLPYFKMSEDNDAGADAWRGAGGPWQISSIRGRHHRATQLAMESALAYGASPNPDFNGERQEGVGLYQFSFRNGRRTSSATAFLDPARRRPNLKVLSNTLTLAVEFEGRRAVGVRYRSRDGVVRTARARREVVVSAGAVSSPLLLQRSGIGPAALLKLHGVPVVCDSPQVGENLQDHVFTGFTFRTSIPTMNRRFNNWPSLIAAGLQYLTTHTGPLTFGINQGGAFLKTRPEEPRPDTQLYFIPLSFQAQPEGGRRGLRPHRFNGMTINASPCRPESRGRLFIRSAEPEAPPVIHRNYLATEADVRVMVDSLRIVERLSHLAPLADIIDERLYPSKARLDDADLEAWARHTGRTTYHPTSTCIMGPDPRTAVVDARLRVHGVDGLRVVDASIMPVIVSGNTNAAATMIGEKGAALILADQ